MPSNRLPVLVYDWGEYYERIAMSHPGRTAVLGNQSSDRFDDVNAYISCNIPPIGVFPVHLTRTQVCHDKLRVSSGTAKSSINI